MGANQYDREFEDLLREHGAELVSQNPHRKWRFPDGRSFTSGSTPSDHRASQNALAVLKRFLNIPRDTPKDRPSPTDRTTSRSKGPRLQAISPLASPARNSMRQQIMRMLNPEETK